MLFIIDCFDLNIYLFYFATSLTAESKTQGIKQTMNPKQPPPKHVNCSCFSVNLVKTTQYNRIVIQYIRLLLLSVLFGQIIAAICGRLFCHNQHQEVKPFKIIFRFRFRFKKFYTFLSLYLFS